MAMNKFTKLGGKFAEMYNDGLTYDEICSKLDICLWTALRWRNELGLPSRRRTNGSVSWMDEKKIQGNSPREILEKIAGPLGLSPKDIELILVRFGKLKSRGTSRGRSQIELILTAAYLYVRWDESGKQPVSPYDFLAICWESGFDISRRNLHMHCRLFRDANLFPRSRLNPQQLLVRKWNSIKTKLGISDETKTTALELISKTNWRATTAEAASAASLYKATQLTSQWVTQAQLAQEFGITEATLRNAVKLIERNSKKRT